MSQVGAKSMLSFVDKSYVVAISWDHSGLSDGIRRLKSAVADAEGFPQPTEAAYKLVRAAQLSLKVGSSRDLAHGGI